MEVPHTVAERPHGGRTVQRGRLSELGARRGAPSVAGAKASVAALTARRFATSRQAEPPAVPVVVASLAPVRRQELRVQVARHAPALGRPATSTAQLRPITAPPRVQGLTALMSPPRFPRLPTPSARPSVEALLASPKPPALTATSGAPLRRPTAMGKPRVVAAPSPRAPTSAPIGYGPSLRRIAGRPSGRAPVPDASRLPERPSPHSGPARKTPIPPSALRPVAAPAVRVREVVASSAERPKTPQLPGPVARRPAACPPSATAGLQEATLASKVAA